MIDISSCHFYNQWATTPSNNLLGGLGAKLTAEIEFFVHWETMFKDLTFYGDQIIRNDGGSFINDRFRLGQTIYVEYTGTSSSPSNVGEYTIVNISNDIITVGEITSSVSDPIYPNGTLPFATEIGTVEYNVHGTTKVQNINFYYGLVENASPSSFASLLDGEIQKYTKNGLDTDASNTYTLDIANSNKSWISGTSTDITNTIIQELGTGYTGVSTGFEQAFKISLPFYISPAFLDSMLDANGEIDQSLFLELAGANSLKFVYKFEAGTDNTSFIFSSDGGNINAFTNNGAVGFYDEYRNTSVTPEYSVTSVTYKDPNNLTVDSLIKNATTSVTVVLNSANGRFANNLTRVAISIYEVPEVFSDVKNNANTMFTNFDVSFLSVIEGAAASDNNNIDDYEVAYVDANTINLTFDYLPPNANKQYLIVVETARQDELDMTLTDGMTLLVDYNSFAYQVDLSEIYTSENGIVVNEHSSNSIERSFTDYKGWVEDGVLFTNNFNITSVGGYSNELTIALSSVVCKIEAVNSVDSSRNFTLEEFTLTPPNEDTGRTFILPTGDPKNYLSLTEDSVNAGSTDYTVEYATKLRWEEWLSQANADPDFTSPTKNWSTYQAGNWSVKMTMYFNLTGTDTDENEYTFTVNHGCDVGILNYDDYDGCIVTGEIETFHEPTMTDLEGQISKTANTFVRATFYGKKLFPCIYNPSSDCSYTQILSGSGSTSEDIVALDCPDLYGILELDDPINGGENFIKQISSMYDPETGTPWIGESGVRAKITFYPYAATPKVVVEAVLDIDQLDLSIDYKLSARLGEKAGTICMVAITYSPEGEDFLTYTNSDLNGFAEDDLLIFGNGLNQDSYGNIQTFSPPTITFKTAITGLKICCASDGRIDDTKAGSSYSNALLVGLDECDFLFFTRNGTEATTQAGYTFTSGTGDMAYSGNNGAIIIDFKEAFICETLAAQSTYTDAQLIGLTMADILVFSGGYELTSVNYVTLSGDTLTFSAPITGKIKVCRVNG